MQACLLRSIDAEEHRELGRAIYSLMVSRLKVLDVQGDGEGV